MKDNLVKSLRTTPFKRKNQSKDQIVKTKLDLKLQKCKRNHHDVEQKAGKAEVVEADP